MSLKKDPIESRLKGCWNGYGGGSNDAMLVFDHGGKPCVGVGN